MSKSSTRYIGPYEIVSENILNDEVVEVSFASYTNDQGQEFQPPTRQYTHKKLYHIVTDEPTDMNTLQEKMYAPLVEEIVKLLISYDINLGFRNHVQNDLEYVLTALERKIVNWRNVYEDRLWGSEEHEKTLRQLVQGLADTDDKVLQELKLVKPRPTDQE